MSHISFSELKNWDKCPFYHKLIHKDKIKLFKGNEYTAFGTSIHNTLEKVVLNEEVDYISYFKERFAKMLFELEIQLDSNNRMFEQGSELIGLAKSELREYFGEYEVFSVEEPLMENAGSLEKGQEDYKFKGYIDLVLKTKDGKYHIIDWKTCSWGWDSRKKSDRMVVYQLILYKNYFSKKHNINPDDISVYFGLLKRTAKSNKIEIFKTTSGYKRTDNAINFLNKALYNISKENHIKNRLACTYCEFYKTEHCK